MGKLTIITGDDDFAVKERARIVADLLSGGNVDANPAAEIIAGDRDEERPEEIMARFLGALRTPPFLVPEKLVWLRHYPTLDLLAGKDAAEVYRDTLAFLAVPLPPEVTVLIDGGALDARKGLAKALKASGAEFEVLNVPKGNARQAADDRRIFIREHCRAAGKEIDPAASQYLTDTVAADTGTLRHELDKLIGYAGNANRITLDDCRAVASRTPEAVSWDFTGAVVARNARQSLRLLDQLFRQGEAEVRIIYLLSNEFQNLIQTRMALKELGITRVSPRTFDSISSEVRERCAGNPLLKLHPYRAFKTCEGAAAYRDEELAAGLELIRDTFRSLVSGGGDRRIALEQLILKLTMKKITA